MFLGRLIKNSFVCQEGGGSLSYVVHRYLWVRNVREESARGLMLDSSRFEEMLFVFCFEESGIERCHV
jgi:hypothetical protein